MTTRCPTTFPPPTQQNSANLLQQDANPSDVIDQAIIVPIPDDRDVDSTD